MEDHRKRTIIAGIAVVLAAQAFIAQSNTPAAPKPVGQHVMQDISKWDVNKHGRLDGAELEAFRRDRIRKHQAEREGRAKAAAEARKLDEAARRTRLMPPRKGSVKSNVVLMFPCSSAHGLGHGAPAQSGVSRARFTS